MFERKFREATFGCINFDKGLSVIFTENFYENFQVAWKLNTGLLIFFITTWGEVSPETKPLDRTDQLPTAVQHFSNFLPCIATCIALLYYLLNACSCTLHDKHFIFVSFIVREA